MWTENKIYDEARKVWGFKSQLNASIEEFCELSQVLSKIAHGNKPWSLGNLIDELGDAKLAINQAIRNIEQELGIEDIGEKAEISKKFKLSELIKKIEKAKNER